MPSSSLYKNMPIYARLLDEKGTLQHVCDAFQPEIDAALQKISAIEYLFDPNTAPDQWVFWLQQLVGGANIGDKWIGIGLNPKWPIPRQREWVRRAWKYWQSKGTNWGIREAIALWLLWEKAHSNALIINTPLGKTPSAYLPGWWEWGTAYNDNLYRNWIDIKRLGHGDYAQTYQPNWYETPLDPNVWVYGQAQIRQGTGVTRAARIESRGSAMGAGCVWMHFFPTPLEWNLIFPNIHELLPEAVSSSARPTVFGWLNQGETPLLEALRNPTIPATQIVTSYTPDGIQWGDPWPQLAREDNQFEPGFAATVDVNGEPQNLAICNVVNHWSMRQPVVYEFDIPVAVTTEDLFNVYPSLGRVSRGSEWELLLELDDTLAILHPSVMYWVDAQGTRSQEFIASGGEQKLYLEFLLTPTGVSRLHSLSLTLKEVPDISLERLIDTQAIAALISDIDEWLQFYTRQPSPFVISEMGIGRSLTGTELGLPNGAQTAVGQMELALACVNAYAATGLTSFRDRGIQLAESLINYFYRANPIALDSNWFPNWIVNAENAFTSKGPIAQNPENYGKYDVLVFFEDGVGTVDANLADVFKVYAGQLTDRSVDAALAEGRSYEIDSWVNANQAVITPPPQEEEFAEQQGPVVFVDITKTAFFDYSGSIFIYALF